MRVEWGTARSSIEWARRAAITIETSKVLRGPEATASLFGNDVARTHSQWRHRARPMSRRPRHEQRRRTGLPEGVVAAERMAALSERAAESIPYRVHRWKQVTADIVILEITPCGQDHVAHLPGQYLKILVPGSAYAFSIANVPNRQRTLELHVRLTAGIQRRGVVPDSTNKVLFVQGPFGRTYEFAPEKPAVLIAGGTGVAPAKCLIEHQFERAPGQPVFLFWSAKSEEDLYLTDVFVEWAKARPNFCYVPILSRASSAAWLGKQGLVQDVLMKEFPMLLDANFYVSGPRPMVEAVKAALCCQGLPEGNFHSDVYG